MARNKKTEFTTIVRDFIRYHTDDHIRTQQSKVNSAFNSEGYPSAMTSYLFGKFGYNGISLHKKQLRKPKLTGQKERELTFKFFLTNEYKVFIFMPVSFDISLYERYFLVVIFSMYFLLLEIVVHGI
jgi:hypothetical protein